MRHRATLAAAAAMLAGCAPPGPAVIPAPEGPAAPHREVTVRDIHSYARPEQARVTHVDLDLRTDFAAKRISGTAGCAPVAGRAAWASHST